MIGLEVVNPVVYFIISSFFMGFAFYDFSLERYGVGTFSSWGVAFSNKLHMVLTGGLFTLLFMIPFAGVILAPILVTMISTAAYIKMRGSATPPATV
jgi:CysZ protein